jgi:hypothetical protein
VGLREVSGERCQVSGVASRWCEYSHEPYPET